MCPCFQAPNEASPRCGIPRISPGGDLLHERDALVPSHGDRNVAVLWPRGLLAKDANGIFNALAPAVDANLAAQIGCATRHPRQAAPNRRACRCSQSHELCGLQDSLEEPAPGLRSCLEERLDSSRAHGLVLVAARVDREVHRAQILAPPVLAAQRSLRPRPPASSRKDESPFFGKRHWWAREERIVRA